MSEPLIHYRSDLLVPRRVSVPTKTVMWVANNSETAPALINKTSEVGVIGNTYLNTCQITGYHKAARFIGYGNYPDMKSGISVVVRLIPRFDGFAPVNQGGLFCFVGATGSPWFGLWQNNDGTTYTISTNPMGDGEFSANSGGAIAYQFVSGTAVDVVVTWTGDTTTNGVKIWYNGVVIAQGTANRNSTFDSIKGNLFESICVPNGYAQGMGNKFDLNEFAVYGEVIDPVAMGLTGSSRTQWLTSTASDAMPTIPAIGNVKLGVAVGYGGTGTRTDASPNDTVVGASYGDPANPILGNYVEVPASKVEAPTAFGSNGSRMGELITGCDYPEEDEVQDGIIYANGTKTGTFGKHIPLTNGYWAPLESQKEIFKVLNSDLELNTLLLNEDLSKQKVFDDVPQDESFPYVSMQIMPFNARDNHTYDGLECELQLNVFYQPGKPDNTGVGNRTVQLIQKRIDELIQKRKLCIDGWNVLQLRRTYINIETDTDSVTKQGIQRYKLYLGEK